MFNVDYGDLDWVPFTSIRYLTKELLNHMKAQAIRSIAKLGRMYNIPLPRFGLDYHDKGNGWTQNAGYWFRLYVKVDEDLVVKFVKKTSIKVSYNRIFVNVTFHSKGVNLWILFKI